MKINFARVTGLCLILVIALAIYFHKDSEKKDLALGVYDPQGEFAGDDRFLLELAYFNWTESPIKLTKMVDGIIQKDRVPVITLEPWPYSKRTDVLNDTANGKYDEETQILCSSLGRFDRDIIIRWGHNMEVSGNEYPWAYRNPEKYTSAYRHFVETCRKADPEANLRYMWSPTGEAGTRDYWPGGDVVDVIGLSLYSFDEYEKKNNRPRPTFRSGLLSKYMRVLSYDRPIVVTEMGVTGDEEYRREWISDMFKSSKTYGQLVGAIYSNTKEPDGSWGNGVSAPDWHIEKSAFDGVPTASSTAYIIKPR